MSLKHWWKLTKDTKDSGLDYPYDLTVVTNTRSNIGKLAGSYTFSGASTQRMYAIARITEAITYCLWIKFDNIASACHILDHRSASATNGIQPLYWTGSGSNGMQIYTTNGINQYISAATLGLTESNKWYHLAVYIDNSHFGIYVNGELKANYQKSGSAVTYALQQFMIGCRCNGANPFKGSICDVRIYDEVLTKEQVHQISQGLLMHYNFEDPFFYYNSSSNISNLAYNTEWTNQNIVFLAESLSFDDIALVKQGSTDYSSIISLSNSSLKSKISTNTPYTVSMFLYKDNEPFETTKTTISTENSITVLSHTSREDGYFEVTFTFGSLTSDNLFYNDLFGACDAGTSCEIRNLRWEIGEALTPIYEITNTNLQLYDLSGFEMNLNPVDIIPEGIKTTGIGVFSGRFNGTSSVCKKFFENSPINSADAFTINCWFKTSAAVNGALFSDRAGTGNGPALFIISGSSIRFDTNNTSCSYSDNNIKDGNWHMVTAVFDATARTRKIYFDGVLKTTASSSTLGSVSSGYVGIGGSSANNNSYNNFLNGSISDWKLFRTALSAADIQKEYKSMARLDKEYHLGTRSVIENESRTSFAKLNKAGQFNCREIIETEAMKEYTPIESITSSGTQYIDTGYYFTSSNTEIIADIEILNADGTLWGNCESCHNPYYNRDESLYSGEPRSGGNGYYWIYYGNAAISRVELGLNERILVKMRTAYNESLSRTDVTIIKNGTILASSYTNSPILAYENAITQQDKTGNICIFANNTSGTISEKTGGMKLYKFQIWDNGKLVRDFIPAKDSNSVAGLYDRANLKFYSPQGGTFTAGTNTTFKKFQTLNNGGLITTSFYEY